MNKLYVGIILLLLLLGLGIGLLWGSVVFFGDFSREMERSGEAALTENWTLAMETAEKCRKNWERYRCFWAAFTDHAPIEQVQALFSQLEVYEKRHLTTEFAACCRALAQEAEAIRESHSLAWWSIL